jgi:hypothetical protein
MVNCRMYSLQYESVLPVVEQSINVVPLLTFELLICHIRLNTFRQNRSKLPW